MSNVPNAGYFSKRSTQINSLKIRTDLNDLEGSQSDEACANLAQVIINSVSATTDRPFTCLCIALQSFARVQGRDLTAICKAFKASGGLKRFVDDQEFDGGKK
jgi:hypothetical protein